MFEEMNQNEILGVNGGADWDDLGFYAATAGGAALGSLAGPIGAIVCGGIGGIGYILIDKFF